MTRTRLVWYLMQVLPLAYWTTYGDEQGRRHMVAWRMWLGRSFDITDVVIADG